MNSKADYEGFGMHLQEALLKGIPTDRHYLLEVCERYNCPPPVTDADGNYIFKHETYEEWYTDLKANNI